MKRDADLDGLPARIISHTLPEEKLKELFPDGYKELPVQIYKRLSVIPQTFIVDEHHVHVYASKNNDGTIVRAPHPKDVFRNSIATPSLMAVIPNAKYSLHQPIERLAGMFKENGANLGTNTMCNWVVKGAEEYLSLVYDELHKRLYDSDVIHADETPLRVTKDGRPPNSKSYMWVYCNNTETEKRPAVTYDYQKTRKADHPREFLSGYSGTVITDGYSVYHTLERERQDLAIAGCWVHAKRKFSEITKALQYCLNPEPYLRVFLKRGDVPMDNNAAERAIRPFTLGRKNQVSIDTVNGAKASAIIYSLVETAKANNIKVLDYFELLFTEMPEHMEDDNLDFISNLPPWSEHVQKKCKAPAKQ